MALPICTSSPKSCSSSCLTSTVIEFFDAFFGFFDASWPSSKSCKFDVFCFDVIICFDVDFLRQSVKFFVGVFFLGGDYGHLTHMSDSFSLGL